MSGGNAARDLAGVTVTLERRETGERWTVVRRGFTYEALAAALEGHDPEAVRVVAVSTPHTILADVLGRPDFHVAHDVKRRRVDGAPTTDHRGIGSPESIMLGRIGAGALR